MAEWKQKADGSFAVYREGDGKEVFRAGGPATPADNTATYIPGTVAKIPLLASGSTGTGALCNVQNPLGVAAIVGLTNIVPRQTYVNTGHIDVGVATGLTGAVSSVNLINGLTMDNADATMVFDNITNKGTSGKASQILNATDYIVASCDKTAYNSSGYFGDLYVTLKPL